MDVPAVIKRALESFFLAAGRLLSPILKLYGWWIPLRFGPTGNAVPLPGSTLGYERPGSELNRGKA